MNQSNFIGRMVRDAEDISGDGVKFTLAVDVYKGPNNPRETLWVPCVAFGKVVDVIKNYAPKGKLVRITAEYQQREYEKGGVKVKDHSFRIVPIDGFELLASPSGGSGNSGGSPEPEGW